MGLPDIEDSAEKQSAPNAQDFEDAFVPREYLDEYYGVGLNDEDIFHAKFLTSVVAGLPDGFSAHEFGGGPALYSVAALAARAGEIHFSDVVHASLVEVRHWLEGGPDAFDWRPYIRITLEAEGQEATDVAVAKREAEMRRLMTRLMICDAQQARPLGDLGLEYEVVAANHCTDVAATTVPEWYEVMRNVSTIVKPGGWLIILVTNGSRVYTVGQHHFRCADLTAADMYNGFVQAGFDPSAIRVETHQVEIPREYNGIIAAVGRKLG